MKFPKPTEDPFGDSISVVQDVTTPRSPRTGAERDVLRERLHEAYVQGVGIRFGPAEVRALLARLAEAAAPRSGEGLREALHEAVNDVPWSTRTLPLYREDILKAIDYVLAAGPRENTDAD